MEGVAISVQGDNVFRPEESLIILLNLCGINSIVWFPELSMLFYVHYMNGSGNRTILIQQSLRKPLNS